MYYNVFYTKHHRFVLMDRDPKPKLFVPLLKHVTSFPVLWYDELPGDHLFRVAVLGLSRDVRVAEIDNEFHEEERFYLRSKVYRMLCEHVKESILEQQSNTLARRALLLSQGVQERRIPGLRLLYPRVSLVARNGVSRRILNQADFVRELRKLRIQLNVYSFDKLSLKRQIQIIDKTDVLISMHGAALTHTLYMRPNTYILELFPYSFRKMIFQNLAHIMEVNYVYWQNSQYSRTRLNWTAIAKNRMTDMPKNLIARLPVDWSNMDSKNYWRNQDTLVNIPEIKYVLNTLLQDLRIQSNTKYLIYLPWEQLNNQLNGLKCACAMAKFLDRTLVIPEIGHRRKRLTGSTNYIPYKPTEFIWKPIDRYFDSTSLLKLPCKHISIQNFQSLNKGRSIGAVNFINLGDGVTWRGQLKDYYKHVVRIPYDNIENRNVYYQLSKGDILAEYSDDDSRVLALGSLFSHYDFNVKMEYPLQKYYDYLDRPTDPMYRQIAKSLEFSERLLYSARRILGSVGVSSIDVAIHYRIGDYHQKCKDSGTLSCLISPQMIEQVLLGYLGAAKGPERVLFCSTNDYESAKHELANLSKEWRVLFFDEMIGQITEYNRNVAMEETDIYQDDLTPPEEQPVAMDLDQTDYAILDQIICISAQHFVGNFHSSFTRTIAEKRSIAGKKNSFF